MFSNATAAMLSAMIGSTIEPGTCTQPSVASASVTEWASVKVVTWSSSGRHVRLRKKRPRTKRMWSSPSGSTWRKPWCK